VVVAAMAGWLVVGAQVSVGRLVPTLTSEMRCDRSLDGRC
jgi:hypothetical protein